MRKILTMAMIVLLCLSTFSIFSPCVHALVTVMPTRLPQGIQAAASVWDGTNAYIFGGTSHVAGPFNQITKYNPITGSISLMSATLSDPVCDFPAVWTGGYAYLFGGYVAPLHTSDKIVRYDPSTDTIAVMGAKLPTYAFPLYSMAAIWDGNCAFLFGGYDGYSYFDQILRYDPINDEITVMGARLPTGTKWMPAVWSGTYAYIFGGSDLNNQCQGDILRYDPTSDSITTVDNLPSPRRWTCAIWDGSSAYIFGGEDLESRDLDEIVRFTPIPTTFAFSPPYDDAVSGHDGSKYRKGLAYATYESSHDSLLGNAHAKSEAFVALGGISTAKARAWFGDDWMCHLEGTYRITFTWQWSMDAHMWTVKALVSLSSYITIEIVDASTNTVIGEFTKVLWEKTESNLEWNEYHEAAETNLAVYVDLDQGHTYKWVGYIGTKAGAVVVPPSYPNFIRGAGYGDISVVGTLQQVQVELSYPQPPF